MQVIAVDLFHATLRHTGVIMSRTAYIVLADAATVQKLNRAFQLPWTPESEWEVGETVAMATERTSSIIEGESCDDVLKRVADVSEELTSQEEQKKLDEAVEKVTRAGDVGLAKLDDTINEIGRRLDQMDKQIPR